MERGWHVDKLVVCQVCHRHVKQGDGRCPFCRSAMPEARASVLLAGAVAVGIGLSLAACSAISTYGPPPYDAAPPVDSGSDADGGMLGAYGPPPPQDAGHE